MFQNSFSSVRNSYGTDSSFAAYPGAGMLTIRQKRTSLSDATEVLGSYCSMSTEKERDDDIRKIGKYSRENQLISAVASSSKNSNELIRQAIDCKNVKLLDNTKLICIKDDSGNSEFRYIELTSLMIACIMGQLNTVKQLVQMARLKLKPEEFNIFINVKVSKEMGGNNALLYSCNSSHYNDDIFNYLIQQAGANINVMNDYYVNCLLDATKKQQVSIL